MRVLKTRLIFLIVLIGGHGVSQVAACNMSLGMESNAISDQQIISGGAISSSKPFDARYQTGNGWCTIGGKDYDNGKFNPNNFLQIDLGIDHTISGLILQGSKNNPDYSYGPKVQVQWRDNATAAFGYYKGSQGRDLQTSNLKNSIGETIVFTPPLCGRYIRFLPLVDANPKCVRLEVLGCAGCYENQSPQPPVSSNAFLSSTRIFTSTVSTKQIVSSQMTIAPSDQPRQKQESKIILIVVIVLLLVLLVIITIMAYRFRSRICLCLKQNNNSGKNGKSKKLGYHVEATYSMVGSKGEPERLSLIILDDQQKGGTDEAKPSLYSEVYAAPTIKRNNYKHGITGAEPGEKEQNSTDGDIYEPMVKYSEPDNNQYKQEDCEREPIYAGSQIYENPYQAVTGSSLYANPDFVVDKGLTKIPEFPRGKLKYLEKIGEGQFGEVHICEVENLNLLVQDSQRFSCTFGDISKVAVKILKKGMEVSVEDEFMKEARVMSRLEHENVVQLIGVCYNEPKSMVVEYMENGDLMQFLQASSQGINTQTDFARVSQITGDLLTKESLNYIAMQVAAGMRYLASEGFVHRDLATRNCLVGRALTVKIADFGMSRYLYSKLYYRIEGKATLPIRWMAPESLYYGTFTSQTDVWAFAVTVWEIFMFAAEQPYHEISDQLVIDNALSVFERRRSNFRYLSKPAYCPDDVYPLLMKCWQKTSENRPSFQELYAFFKQRSGNVVEGEI